MAATAALEEACQRKVKCGQGQQDVSLFAGLEVHVLVLYAVVSGASMHKDCRAIIGAAQRPARAMEDHGHAVLQRRSRVRMV